MKLVRECHVPFPPPLGEAVHTVYNSTVVRESPGSPAERKPAQFPGCRLSLLIQLQVPIVLISHGLHCTNTALNASHFCCHVSMTGRHVLRKRPGCLGKHFWYSHLHFTIWVWGTLVGPGPAGLSRGLMRKQVPVWSLVTLHLVGGLGQSP